MGTISEKLTYLNETKQELKQAINNLGGSITDETTFREYVDQLDNVYDVLPKTSFQEGTDVTIENGLKGKLDFDDGKVGFGQASQESTQGYNLAEVNTDNYTLEEEYIWTNKKNNSTGLILFDEVQLTANTTYYLKFVVLQKPTASASFTGYTDNVVNNNASFGNIDNTSYVIGQVYTKQYTPASNETLSVKLWGNGNNETIKFQYWITTDNSKDSYEPYTNGASPNPSYPQEIKYVRGKNRFNGTLRQGVTNYQTGTYSNTATRITTTDWLTLPKGTYTISGKTSTNKTLTISNITFDTNGNYYEISGISGQWKTLPYTITLPKDTKWQCNLGYSDSSNITPIEVSEVQIEEGTQATPYLPYNTIQETIRGINFFEAKMATDTSGGVTVTNNNDGTFTLNGTATGNLTFRLDQLSRNSQDNLKTYENGTYTLSIGNSKSGLGMSMMQIDTYRAFMYVGSGSSLVSRTLTNATNMFIYLDITSGTQFSNFVVKPMLVKGTYTAETLPNFEPYVTPRTYQFSLGNNKLYDECYIVGSPDNWKFVEWHEKVILKDLNWGRYGTNTSGKYRYYTADVSTIIEKTSSNANKTTKGLQCNIMSESTPNQNFLNLNNSICSSVNGTLYVYIESVSTETDTTALINLLTNTNAYAVIPLAQAKETPIIDTTLIEQLNNWYYSQSYNGTTIIESNGDLPMIIKVRALKGE